MLTAANLITFFRIPASAALLFFPVFSAPFVALYIAAGVSDMIDGAIARKTNTVSAFGSKLDTIADLTLVSVCLVRILPKISVPVWLYVWIAVIAAIKITNVVSGYIIRKEFAALHTVMNKVTGAMMFILPLTLPFIDFKYAAAAVCASAMFAAVQEGHLIRTGKGKSVQS